MKGAKTTPSVQWGKTSAATRQELKSYSEKIHVGQLSTIDAMAVYRQTCACLSAKQPSSQSSTPSSVSSQNSTPTAQSLVVSAVLSSSPTLKKVDWEKHYNRAVGNIEVQDECAGHAKLQAATVSLKQTCWICKSGFMATPSAPALDTCSLCSKATRPERRCSVSESISSGSNHSSPVFQRRHSVCSVVSERALSPDTGTASRCIKRSASLCESLETDKALPRAKLMKFSLSAETRTPSSPKGELYDTSAVQLKRDPEVSEDSDPLFQYNSESCQGRSGESMVKPIISYSNRFRRQGSKDTLSSSPHAGIANTDGSPVAAACTRRQSRHIRPRRHSSSLLGPPVSHAQTMSGGGCVGDCSSPFNTPKVAMDLDDLSTPDPSLDDRLGSVEERNAKLGRVMDMNPSTSLNDTLMRQSLWEAPILSNPSLDDTSSSAEVHNAKLGRVMEMNLSSGLNTTLMRPSSCSLGTKSIQECTAAHFLKRGSTDSDDCHEVSIVSGVTRLPDSSPKPMLAKGMLSDHDAPATPDSSPSSPGQPLEIKDVAESLPVAGVGSVHHGKRQYIGGFVRGASDTLKDSSCAEQDPFSFCDETPVHLSPGTCRKPDANPSENSLSFPDADGHSECTHKPLKNMPMRADVDSDKAQHLTCDSSQLVSDTEEARAEEQSGGFLPQDQSSQLSERSIAIGSGLAASKVGLQISSQPFTPNTRMRNKKRLQRPKTSKKLTGTSSQPAETPSIMDSVVQHSLQDIEANASVNDDLSVFDFQPHCLKVDLTSSADEAASSRGSEDGYACITVNDDSDVEDTPPGDVNVLASLATITDRQLQRRVLKLRPRLKAIFQGNLYNERHEKYKVGGKAAKQMAQQHSMVSSAVSSSKST